MRSIGALLFLITTVTIYSQKITFDFEDESIENWTESSIGHWIIDTSNPIAGKGSLHHNFDTTKSSFDAISVGHGQLCFDSSLTQWKFTVRYDYNPSSGNNWAVWLSSDKDALDMHPAGNTSGYVLGVNYTGSDDFIKLWRQDGKGKSAIITSQFNWESEGARNKELGLYVQRDIAGVWRIMVDTSGAGYYIIAEGVDAKYSVSKYFGVFYEYTSTQDMKLWIDNIEISGKFYIDTFPPAIKDVNVLGRDELEVVFNEPPDTSASPSFILNQQNYPSYLIWKNAETVYVKFDIKFSENNILEVTGVKDYEGNISRIEKASFKYYPAALYDVLISEIMADPVPEVKLPDCEYIELYNNSDKPLDLKGWEFRSGQRGPAILPDYSLKPEEYVLLTDNNCESDYPNSVDLIVFTSFPTLPNSGELLELRDRYGQMIHRVNYSKNWYNDEVKEDGGWSLELVSVDYPCLITNNWTASIAIEGGTPGSRNSVAGQLLDYPVSKVRALSEITAEACVLKYSETLDSVSAITNTNYILEGGTGLSSVKVKDYEIKEVELSFSKELEGGTLYSLTVDEELKDCSGISVESHTMVFGLPENADSADIVITEILFESNEEVPEFVEVYNNSNKIIDLKGYALARIDEFTDTVQDYRLVSEENRQFFPNTYMVLTENRERLISYFDIPSDSEVIEPGSWMLLSNEGGKVGIVDGLHNIIDMSVYHPGMHFSLLTNTSGISLERIEITQSGINTNNWHSAASDVNYASPGVDNSQAFNGNNSNSEFEIVPKEFSPDNDGVDDYLTIQYNFSQPGYMTSIRIFSQQGIEIRKLQDNELCRTTGSFVWDGLGKEGKRLAMGYYVVFIDSWHPEGHRIKKKEAVLLLP